MPLGWSDLTNHEGRIGVWGLGVEGRANIAKLRTLGIEPVEADDAQPNSVTALDDCDVIIKTPGISRYRDDVQRHVERGAQVVGGLGLWLADHPDRSKVILITGTKGKSTTTSIAGHLARGLGVDAVVGGNLGAPPYDTTGDLWIIEVSSYQATDLEVTTDVVGVTSLHPDHLPWHGGEERYYADKLRITDGARHVVANGDDDRLRARLATTTEWITADDAGPWADPLQLIGRHNRANAAIARALLRAANIDGADDDDRVTRAAHGFTGLASRLRLVRTTSDGVAFVDDSLATNVLPTIAAVDAFPDRAVALIVGGHDRGIDYAPLAEHLAARRSPTLALTMPDNGDRIADALEAAGVETVRTDDLEGAVIQGHEWARTRRGVVLLSPAAPSFGRFADYADRARAFEACCEQFATE
ncbi:MAG TPA: UDP-N-acetylmuramoyl-L-alanine--D-glutamate ligase [Acidimicrobiales bacterium]|nr:UDP-N-acetylmuramoyl-L-alanine--D-glutamate ligase [Acidimicrobiales bacterium]